MYFSHHIISVAESLNVNLKWRTVNLYLLYTENDEKHAS